ncbi:MAG: translation elongation factor P, elongation factor P [Candidatus Peregrinibacteria bacterium GW2011_GWE2_39_6]|nr:MAG: translation elongation factor P, elongation factor P [Candidatus Peregrinibacteria bacterium GW2011_GWE2_39_6]
MYSIAQLKVGVAIQVDGHPYLITNSQFSKQARGGGVMKTTIEPANINYTKAQFLYAQGQDYFFMDNENYEQFSFSKTDLGDKTDYLIDGMEVDMQNFEGKPINVQLPPKINLKVTHAEPSIKGDTAQGRVTKPITVETGITILVPLFINEGDVIRVNTDTGEYCERA